MFGQSVTFTATVTSTYGAIPNGETVTFYDGTIAIGSNLTKSGVTSFTTSSLKAKTHTIKATYAGDATFMPSSRTVQQVVNKYPTTTILTSSLNPSQFGQAVTFTAQVTSSGPKPTGSVKFLDGTTSIGLATLSGGVAKLTKSTLAVGTHSIAAHYNGDAASATSTSPVVNQVVQ
jgi:Big-like domain-containing protein